MVEGVPTKRFGPVAWRMLHSLTYVEWELGNRETRAGRQPSEREMYLLAMKHWVLAEYLSRVLMCVYCRRSLSHYLDYCRNAYLCDLLCTKLGLLEKKYKKNNNSSRCRQKNCSCRQTTNPKHPTTPPRTPPELQSAAFWMQVHNWVNRKLGKPPERQYDLPTLLSQYSMTAYKTPAYFRKTLTRRPRRPRRARGKTKARAEAAAAAEAAEAAIVSSDEKFGQVASALSRAVRAFSKLLLQHARQLERDRQRDVLNFLAHLEHLVGDARQRLARLVDDAGGRTTTALARLRSTEGFLNKSKRAVHRMANTF